jgi:hypothetical protein
VALASPHLPRGWQTSVPLYLALALVWAFGPLSGASAQSSASPVSRTIEGQVLDRAGHPVPGAIVLLEDLKSLRVRSYIVQEDGKFRFRGLSSDANYELRARFNGFSSSPKTVSVFDASPAIVVNLMLSVKPKRPAPSANRPPGNPS